jgi:hypothetical protein
MMNTWFRAGIAVSLMALMGKVYGISGDTYHIFPWVAAALLLCGLVVEDLKERRQRR